MDRLNSFKRWGAKGGYRQMSCQGITRQSDVLYRLLTQAIEYEESDWHSILSKKYCSLVGGSSDCLVVISV